MGTGRTAKEVKRFFEGMMKRRIGRKWVGLIARAKVTAKAIVNSNHHNNQSKNQRKNQSKNQSKNESKNKTRGP